MKSSKPAAPANKPTKEKPKKSPDKTAPLADDDPYDQGDMATPERDPPYEDGL